MGAHLPSAQGVKAIWWGRWAGLAVSVSTLLLSQCKDKETEAGGWRDLLEASWPWI